MSDETIYLRMASYCSGSLARVRWMYVWVSARVRRKHCGNRPIQQRKALAGHTQTVKAYDGSRERKENAPSKANPFSSFNEKCSPTGRRRPLGTAYWPHRLGSALRKLPPRSPVPLRMQLLRYNRFLPPSVTSIHRCNTLRLYCPNACHDEMQH